MAIDNIMQIATEFIQMYLSNTEKKKFPWSYTIWFFLYNLSDEIKINKISSINLE